MDGAEVENADSSWEVRDEDGKRRRVKGPREFRHGLGDNNKWISCEMVLSIWDCGKKSGERT